MVEPDSAGSPAPPIGAPAGLLDRLFGIPHLTPAAAAGFRIVIGAMLTWLIWTAYGIGYPDGPVPPLAPGTGYGAGSWPVAHWIRQHPDVHMALHWTTVGAAAAFTVGLCTRVAAVVLWSALLLLLAATLTTGGNHTWGAPLVALLGVVLTPLGDAWSADAIWRRLTGRPAPAAAPSPVYGFAVWWIGLVLGLAFLAAAIAKLRASGLDWALGGAIRYHFVEDAGQAPVPWGLWIAGQPALAIAFSTVGLLIEAGMILVIFCRRDLLRACFGAAFVSMHAGFFLFQGVLWLPWLAMSTAFLPWTTLSRAVGGGIQTQRPDRRLGLAHAVAIAVLLAQQAYATVRVMEYEPLMSNFPMYSGTYPSWPAFFEGRQWHKYQRYRFFVRDADGQRVELTTASELISSLDVDRLIDALQAAYRGDDIPARSTEALAAMRDRLRDRFGTGADRLEVLVEMRRVNFEQMRIDVVAKDLHAFTLLLSPPALTYVAGDFKAAQR